MTRRVRPVAQRFWPKVLKTSGCWEWQGVRDRQGYGSIGRAPGEGNAKAHRLAYELLVAPIPEGMFCLHRCDNPSCVRPDHLFLGTAADNGADARRKGRTALGERSGMRRHPERHVRGERHPQAKLSAAGVLEIRSLYTKCHPPLRELALRFGITASNVSYILRRKSWCHLP